MSLPAHTARKSLCLVGMGAGLLVDLWRSPVGAIVPVCTGREDAFARTLLHVAMMPAAHAGMIVGGIVCVLWHFGRCASPPTLLCLALFWRCCGMAAAELGSLMLLPEPTDPAAMMLVMAAFMLAFDCLAWPTRSWAT